MRLLALIVTLFLAASASAMTAIFDTPEVSGILSYGELGDPASLDLTILDEQVLVDLTSQALFSTSSPSYEVKFALQETLELAQAAIEPSPDFTLALKYLNRSPGDTQTVGLSVSVAAIPEPGSLVLALSGLMMLSRFRA